ncbi:MAG TPA: hypothetical protein VJI52_06580 [Candidatus Nanoarchaeia archaeon]|nr:hypothetical protein [Candidatus Nanoarchaeia archaeon]
MERTLFNFRIVCDKHFLVWVLNQSLLEKRQILRKLMYIKSLSIHHPKNHNVILKSDFEDKDFQNIVKDKLQEQESIHGAVNPNEEPDFLKTEIDSVSKTVRYAIYLSNDKPYKVCILTDDKTQPIYIKNPHMRGITDSVIIKSNQDAVALIDKLYKQSDGFV